MANRRVLQHLDGQKVAQLINMLAHVSAGDPATPAEGQIWYDSVAKTFQFYNGTTAIDLADLSKITPATADVNINSHKLIGVTDPTSAQDAATKAYVDSLINGIDWKQSVRAATTADVATLAGGAPNVIDGVTLAANDRILVKAQTTGSQNGIYTVTTLGTGANGTWTRATDADASAEVTSGMAVPVAEGTLAADTVWILTTNDPITLATTALVFSKAFTAPSTGVQKFSGTGPGSTGSSWAVSHNLGTKDVVVSLRDVATDAEVDADCVHTDTNTVTFTFAASQTLNTLRVVVAG
jgi:hypothetical protein